MSRFRHTDILVELIELCQERMAEIRQQLTYYRASVYKGETGDHVLSRIEHLRLVTGLFGDDLVREAFKDFDAMSKAGALNYIPGECSFSKRVGMLLSTLEENLGRLNDGNRGGSSGEPPAQEFTAHVKKHRQELLAICPQGSRQWSFFQAL